MSTPDTKTRILSAAEAIVLERGVPALTLDAVAESAGLSKGGLIYHFESKEALIRAGCSTRSIASAEGSAASPSARAQAARQAL